MAKKHFILTHVIVAVVMISTIVLSMIGVFPFNSPLGVYRGLPGSIAADFGWIYALSIAAAFIVYMVGDKIALALLVLHRKLLGSTYSYRLSTEPLSQNSTTWRLLVPSFVSLGISIYLANSSDIANSIFVVENFNSLEPYSAMIMTEAMSMFFIMLIVSCFVGILFGPIWILENSGVVYERIVDGEATETSEIGRWYSSRMTGFASVSSILAYIIIASKTILWFQVLPGMIDYPLLFYTIPLLVTIFAPLFAVGPISLSYFLFDKSETPRAC